MNRRELFARLAGCAGAAMVPAAVKAEKPFNKPLRDVVIRVRLREREPHFYDFSSDGPFTTNPAHSGRVCRHDNNRLYLNDQLIDATFCKCKCIAGVHMLLTGSNGWIEGYAAHEDGAPIVSDDNLLKPIRLRGRVDFYPFLAPLLEPDYTGKKARQSGTHRSNHFVRWGDAKLWS